MDVGPDRAPVDEGMRICSNCQVRIELVETAGAGDIWMHIIQPDARGCPRTMYRECRLPAKVATP